MPYMLQPKKSRHRFILVYHGVNQVSVTNNQSGKAPGDQSDKDISSFGVEYLMIR